MSLDPKGPVLVEGPVEIVRDDGTVARSDRFMVAVCTCRRSRSYPWCDTSHRARVKANGSDRSAQDAHSSEDETSAGPGTDDRNLP
ncbi:CDGSH iron-sulfur domain-containing protein [Streptomyces sp. NPDC102487]|uniref:CDGSH iron-sulfur domain-containing protein n=1 Tax=Streptomyces sp. NPDC102487 TaxID=3366182 RepID=UPI00381BB142